MQLHTHLWTSALAALVFYPRQPHYAATLVLSGVFIDLDHLIVYSLRTGDWSITGAVCYDRYRNQRIIPGDTRPRYGVLRSFLHQPLVLLPPVWILAQSQPPLRPAAIGLTLHLVLDLVGVFTGRIPAYHTRKPDNP